MNTAKIQVCSPLDLSGSKLIMLKTPKRSILLFEEPEAKESHVGNRQNETGKAPPSDDRY